MVLRLVGCAMAVANTAQAAASNARAGAAADSGLQALAPLVLDLRSSDCAILCPADVALQGAARELAAAVRNRAGRSPRIVPDTAAPETLGRGPLLMLGNLALGAASRRLYLTAYDFTDYAWPGQGGYVVRTIRDPFGAGSHVLMIGGSAPEDIVAAARRAAAIIAERGPSLGYVNDVKLGRNADAIKGWTAGLLDPAVKWPNKGVSDSWPYVQQIGMAAMGYLRTGDEAYLNVFRDEMRAFFAFSLPRLEAKESVAIHSLLDAILLPWDLLADHTFFTAAERLEFDANLLRIARSQEGPLPRGKPEKEPAPKREVKPGVRNNHSLGRALDAFWLSRYFGRRYRIEDANDWLAAAESTFAPQMLASKPTEDRIYYQYSSSLMGTLVYALAAGKDDYLRSRVLRQAADRAILECDAGYGPMTYLSACAVSMNDPTCLTLSAHAGGDAYVRYCAGMRGAELIGENFRSFCGFTTPREKKEFIGAVVAPLEPAWYRWQGGADQPEGVFDKLVLRDGFAPDSFSLKIDGIYGGDHSYPDANCIVAYRDHGTPWLRVEYERSGPTCSTVRQQNGVFVARNGQAPDRPQRFARLLYVGEAGAGIDAAGGVLEGGGAATWQRHLLRKRGAWTLVLDRAGAGKQGEFLVERHWHMLTRFGKQASEFFELPDGVVCRQGKWAFHLQSAGLPPEGMSGTSSRAEILRAEMPAGGHVDIAALLYVDDQPAARRYELARTAQGWRITDMKEGRVLDAGFSQRRLTVSPGAGADAGGPAPRTQPLKPPCARVTLPWRTTTLGAEISAVAAAGERVAAGTRNGTVAVLDSNGRTCWQANVASRVLALHFLANDLLVGEDNGTLARFDASGRRLWSVTIPYVRVGYEHWSDGRSRIREITAADINGDGNAEILCSNGDRHIYAFTGAGKQMWKAESRRGVHVALTPATEAGKFVLLGGVTGPTLLGWINKYDARGEHLGALVSPEAWAQQIRDIRLFDLDGDGTREIVGAVDAPAGQVLAYPGTSGSFWGRKPAWIADVGGSPDALALRRYHDAVQVLCGSRGRYLHALDGATGEQVWFCWLGDEPRMLWPRADGTVLALCASGTVFIVGAEGRLLARDELGAELTAFLRPGEHRAQPPALPVGGKNGTLYLLPGERAGGRTGS